MPIELADRALGIAARPQNSGAGALQRVPRVLGKEEIILDHQHRTSGKQCVCHMRIPSVPRACPGISVCRTLSPSLSGKAITHRIPLAFSFSRSEEHTSELQSLMRISYAVFCLK